MSNRKYTIVYEINGSKYKLCKILFGSDGSYYVLSPYHPTYEAIAFKITVNYNKYEMDIPIEKSIDIASFDDDEKRLKLSHHPSGLVQFSGQGIISGKDDAGNIKGIGVYSWPLNNPVHGPAFGITMLGIEQFSQATSIRGEAVVFRHDALTPMPGANLLILEGHYFHPYWRRFIQTDQDGNKTISIVHPNGVVLPLKVILASERCDLPGFIGLDLYTEYGNVQGIESGFFLSSSTGNIRKNESDETIGDGIYCMYPRFDISNIRTLNY